METTPSLSQLVTPDCTAYLRSHVKGAHEHLRNASSLLRECSPEQMLYHSYMEAGAPHGPVIYAVKGEHWNGVSPKFVAFLNDFKFTREDMGYAECGYGIQRHRDFMRQLIVAEHCLAYRDIPPALEIDVGCLAMTTRMAMYDLAQVAYKHSRERHPDKKPVALVPTPGWDYRGIFKEVGFEIAYLPIRPQHGWQPALSEWASIADALKQRPDAHIALAVMNPQHNPTGMQWSVEISEFFLDLCGGTSGYLLLDDAYYNVHDPRVPVVNHLKALLDKLYENSGDNALVRSGMFDRWVATRPFGKQFSCNTMGVAAITTSPLLLRQLARESWINRYHCNTHNAEVMCAWLATQDAADWTLETGMRYTRQKERVAHKLQRLMDWPEHGVCIGPSTSYMLFEVPKVYQAIDDGIDRFRDDLFYATGTLVCASLFNQAAPAPFVRLHLGSHPDVIEEILRRWHESGLNYHQPQAFPGKAALSKPIPPLQFRTQAE